MPTQDRTFYTRVFTLVTLGLLGLAAVAMLRPFIAPLLWSGLLAILLFPLNRALRRILRGRRGLAAVLLTVAVILVVVIPAALLLSLFAVQTAELANRLQDVVKEYEITTPSDVLAVPAIDQAIKWVSERLPITGEQAQAWLVQGGQRVLQGLLGLTGALFTGALGAFASVTIAVLLFFFFLRDGEAILDRLLRMIPLEPSRRTKLVEHLSAVTMAVVLGSLVTAVVQGALVGIGFGIAGLPAPVVFAGLAMIASLIPVIGSTLVWVPATLVLLIQHRWGWAIFLAAWCIGLVHSADNVVRPLFISSRARISTLPVFVGLLGGVSAFGAIGMFIGPVLVALFLALAEFWEELQGTGAEG